MTSHELAYELLKLPDIPVVINGWGSDEGITCEVSKAVIINNDYDHSIHLDYDEIAW